MAALILTCYSAYSNGIIKKLVQELGIAEVCLWHPQDYSDSSQMFKPKQTYLAAVHTDLVKRVNAVYKGRIAKKLEALKEGRVLKVFAFRQLVFSVDQQLQELFADRLIFLNPLQYVYDVDIMQSVARSLETGKGVRLQGYFKRNMQGIQLIREDRKLLSALSKSTDKENRAAMSPEQARQCYKLHDQSFATTPQKAMVQLKAFVSQRLGKFAQFQDAVVPGQNQLYHSKLSAPLNCGLITCWDVLNCVLEAYKGRKWNVQESIEAFLRQLLGWREYAVLYYTLHQPNSANSPISIHQSRGLLSPVEICLKTARGSFRHNTRKLKKGIWFNYAQTENYEDTPFKGLNKILKPMWREGYAHHIQRLYILSLMIQLFVDPQEIYRWMMAVFVDSLDFVMLFNVFAMGYFDRRFTHKQYLFSSQYMYVQSGGRIERDDRLDNLYRFFMKTYKQELRYVPVTREVDKQAALAVIEYFTE